MSKYSKRKSRGSGKGSVIGTICLTLFIFSGAVVCTLFSRWLYYLDIRFLDIPAYSGMSTSAIRENYDALIDYCRVWHRGDLVFPSLSMSEAGRIHFQECKRIFDVLQIVFAVTFLGSLISYIRNRRRNNLRYLRMAGILLVMIPIILGVLAALDWNRFFVTFHHIFFRNEYWLFDPQTDPVILMLPDTYFLHCAVMILLIIFIGALICLRKSRRRYRH